MTPLVPMRGKIRMLAWRHVDDRVPKALVLTASCLALLAGSSGAAWAADSGAADLGAEASAADAAAGRDTIIVTGTRRAERTLADSAVPVDVVGRDELAGATPSSDLNDKLARLVPSFNVQRLPLFDGAAFVRPATLRGLSPHHTLLLLNCKQPTPSP